MDYLSQDPGRAPHWHEPSSWPGSADVAGGRRRWRNRRPDVHPVRAERVSRTGSRPYWLRRPSPAPAARLCNRDPPAEPERAQGERCRAGTGDLRREQRRLDRNHRKVRRPAGFHPPHRASNAPVLVRLNRCPASRRLVPQLSWDSWDAAVILTSGFSGASGRGLTSSGSGKVTSTSRPPSGCGQATMLARCASAMACTMDRPRPRPSPRFVRSVPSRWNGWKSRPIAVAETVGPVLATERTARESLVAVVTATRPRATLWRSALSTRLAA